MGNPVVSRIRWRCTLATDTLSSLTGDGGAGRGRLLIALMSNGEIDITRRKWYCGAETASRLAQIALAMVDRLFLLVILLLMSND